MTTKNRDTQPPAPLPPASDRDPVARTEAPLTFAPPASDEMVQIPRAQLDQLLDGMNDMQDQIDALKSAQTGQSAEAVGQSDQTARFDAELAELTEEFKDYPAIEMFERRALVGLDANLDIRLKDDPSVLEDPDGDRCRWKLRWFNFAKEGRSQQAAAEGYVRVRWDELADEETITGGSRLDTYVRKGERGLEVLHKIPLKLYNYKKRRDAARQAGLLSSVSGVRNLLAERVAGMAAATGGNADRAGSFMAGKAVQITVKPGATERVDSRSLEDIPRR